MRKGWIAAAVLGVCLLLTGCADIGSSAKDDRKLMVSSIGFDEAGDKIKASVEVIIINSENYDSAAKTKVLTGEGDNIEQAIGKIGSSLTKPMLFNHCGVIGIGKGIGAERFAEICAYCFSDERITLSAYMITADDCETLFTGEPEASVTVGYDMMGIIEQESAETGVVYNSRYFEVESKREEGKNTFSLPHFVRNSSGIAVDGMTVFHNDRQIKQLNNDEAGLYALITGEIRKGRVKLNAGEYEVTDRKLSWGKNRITLKVKVDEKNKTDAFKQTLLRFRREIEQETGLDAFGFTDMLNQRNPGEKRSEADFAEIDFTVQCRVKGEDEKNGKVQSR